MPTRVEKLTLKYNDILLDPLWVIKDSDDALPILPLLFSTHLSSYGTVFEVRELADYSSTKKISLLAERDISDSTIRSYIYCLSQFLDYLESESEPHHEGGMHSSTLAGNALVNHYLNYVLADKLDSAQSLGTHQSALTAYYNWLDHMEICPRLSLKIHRKTRQLMADKSQKEHYIQYVSRYSRASLLNSCCSLAEKLIMRMGFEVGLRTSELVGLRIFEDSPLDILFKQLDQKRFEPKEYFSYLLQGRYTKGGRSRWIYFDRALLEDIRRYVRTERQWLIDETGRQSESLFLRTDHRFKSTGITEEHATRIFRKRSRIAGLNPLLKFHDLRHTFGTELFHAELASTDGRETRSESAALIVVAQRLGHAFTRSGQAPSTTTRYIRMRIQMLEIESAQYE